jgi:methylated-DNA-[protein]-cysteine S-methyltransferase
MNTETYTAVIGSPLGALGIRVEQGALCDIDFLPQGMALKTPADPLSRRVVKQLQAYFQRPRPFDLPLSLEGTAFQQRVWAAMQAIPPGEVRCYGQLAEILGSSPRAVGNACRANPVPIVVPCHRVVAANSLGGYGGAVSGPVFDSKRVLLMHEGVLAADT